MIGILIYLASTAYAPQALFIIAALAILYRERVSVAESLTQFYSNPKRLINWNFLLILIIVFLSTINRIIHWNQIPSPRDVFPFYVLLIPTYFLSVYIRKQDVKILIACISVESIVVILEWLAGVSTFDSSLAGFREFGGEELMYNNRPIGLSTSSSIVAYKLLLGWMLIYYYKWRSWPFQIALGLILAAILFTFNRSVILSFGVFVTLYYLQAFFTFRYDKARAILFSMAGAFLFAAVAVILYLKSDVIVAQLTRNTGNIELTGRQYIWMDFWEFIQNNLVYGNSSIKLWLDGYHAHNSYIQLIATNGVFIALVYFALIYRNTRLQNLIFIVPILVLGLTQYAFFWGISFLDIIFGMFLYQIRPSQT